MIETTKFNPLITKALTDMGVKFEESKDGFITVDRTSMVRAFPHGDEFKSYESTMDLIKTVLPTDRKECFISWSGRTDEWLGVSVNTYNRKG